MDVFVSLWVPPIRQSNPPARAEPEQIFRGVQDQDPGDLGAQPYKVQRVRGAALEVAWGLGCASPQRCRAAWEAIAPPGNLTF